MRAVITGAEGFVGPYLKDHLEEMNDTVISLDRKSGLDVCDPAACKEAIATSAPDIIYHLAGWSNIASSWENPIDCFQVNALGTVNMLEAARLATAKRFVLISSADVYQKSAATTPIHEEYPLLPDSPYGLSKQAAESSALQYWNGYGVETVIARPFNHIGAGQRKDFVVPSFAQKVVDLEKSGGGTIKHGDLTPKRDFTHVRDVVRAYRLLATHGEPGEAYNICSSTPVSIKELLDHFLNLTNAPIEAEIDESLLRPVDCPYRVGSFEKLTKKTGWQPQWSLTTSLQEVLEEKR